MKRYSVLLSMILFLPFFAKKACAQSDSIFIVKGEIDTVPNATYYVSYSDRGTDVNDTIVLDANHKFELQGTLTEPTPLSLRIKNTYNTNVVGDFVVYKF